MRTVHAFVPNLLEHGNLSNVNPDQAVLCQAHGIGHNAISGGLHASSVRPPRGGLILFINYRDGSSRPGLIVGLSGGVIRVALAGCEDLLEFRLVDNQWISDECEVVSFEFPPGITQHSKFRAAVAESIKPPDRLYGYLSIEQRITETVN